MRPLRLTLVIAVAAGLLLAGCTDPSPVVSPPATGSASSEPTADATVTDEPTAEPTATDSLDASEPPVFGTTSGQPGAATACVPSALGVPMTFSTVLTAADPITIDALTLQQTPADAPIELLDAYVLPFEAGAAGLAVGAYPPADPHGAREDAAGYELGAGESVTVGVGVTADAAATLTLALTYHGADGVSGSLTSLHTLTLAGTCTPE